MVTPLAGVWIEIFACVRIRCTAKVTPLAGVWIEILFRAHSNLQGQVTPLAGVWIEIKCYVCLINEILSLPLRECGLKLL